MATLYHVYIVADTRENTVEPVLKYCPTDHNNMVSYGPNGNRSVTLKFGTFCQNYAVLQDRWSLTAVVSQDRFHCKHSRLRPKWDVIEALL